MEAALTLHSRSNDEFGTDYRSERQDREGKTERWVKWTVMISLSIIVPLTVSAFRLSNRLTKLETTADIYSQQRMELDRRISDELTVLIDQHRELISLQSRLVEILNRRDAVPSRPIPAFGKQ